MTQSNFHGKILALAGAAVVLAVWSFAAPAQADPAAGRTHVHHLPAARAARVHVQTFSRLLDQA
jgi:hypothetical protein